MKILFKVFKSERYLFEGNLFIENDSDAVLVQGWKLCFNLARKISIPAECSEKADVIKSIGDYHEISFKHALRQDECVNIPLEGNYFINKYTDAISGCFVVNGLEIEEVSPEIDLSAVQSTDTNPYDKYVSQNTAANDSKLSSAILSDSEIPLIPKTSEAKVYGGVFKTLGKKLQIVNDTKYPDDEFLFVFNEFKELWNGTKFVFADDKNISSNSVFLKKIEGPYPKIDNRIKEEGYILKVSTDKIMIEAAGFAGFVYGIISLLQLLKTDGTILCCEIIDYPRFGYRGLLIDTGKNFRTVKELKDILRLMALYKLNYFHWHLTEDQGWRIEIKKYPNLTAVGSKRGYGLPIPPAYGSGPKVSGGFYTQLEVKEILDYASKLNITVIPEIDIPGHARALIKSFETEQGNPLVDPGDASVYSSAQLFSDNVLNPAIEYTYEVLENIIKEISELFPGKHIHIGADEIPEGAWIKSPRCMQLMKEKHLFSKTDIQNYFLLRVIGILKKYGKEPAGWEEALEGERIPSNCIIYSWRGTEKGIEAAKRGHKTVMTPAQYLYCDISYNPDVDEPGLYWSGYVDTFRVYSYSPLENLPTDIADKIIGLQACLWSENTNNIEKLQYLAFPKLIAFSELAWSQATNCDWKSFSKRAGLLNLCILDKLDINYRVSPPGIKRIGNKIYANCEFLNDIIKYTLDGSEPDFNSIEYKEPFFLPADTKEVKMKTWRKNGKCSKTISVNFDG